MTFELPDADDGMAPPLGFFTTTMAMVGLTA